MRALILGFTGQDGSYMSELLYSKGYEVHGLVHKYKFPKWTPSPSPFNHEMKIWGGNLLEFNKDDIARLIKEVNPNEIYNFAGVSDVFNPWDEIDKTFSLNAKIPHYILDSIVKVDRSIKFFQASSSLIYGNDFSGDIYEGTIPSPRYPYGCAKLYADNMIKEYRREFGIFACSGIFGSHESPRRRSTFFTKKVSDFAKSVRNGNKEKLLVGNLDQKRDVGYAPDYMEAAHLMLQNKKPTDYIISTGELTSNEDFIMKCFGHIGYNYKNHIEADETLKRPNMTPLLLDNTKIKQELGWFPKHNLDDIVKIMMEND